MSAAVVTLVFLGLVLLRVVLVGVGALAIIRPVRACPACFEDTIPIRKPLLERFGQAFEWRWCPSCGWEGIARRSNRSGWPAPPHPAPPNGAPEARTPRASERDGPAPA